MEGTRARKGIDDQKANSLHVAYKITPIYQSFSFSQRCCGIRESPRAMSSQNSKMMHIQLHIYESEAPCASTYQGCCWVCIYIPFPDTPLACFSTDQPTPLWTLLATPYKTKISIA